MVSDLTFPYRWQATLRAIGSLDSASPDGDLLSLFPGLVEKLGQDLDSYKICLPLMDSYMLLDGARMMQVSASDHARHRITYKSSRLADASGFLVQAYGLQICQAYLTLIQSVDKTNVTRIFDSFETILICCPASIWASYLASSGLMRYLCFALDDEKSSAALLGGTLVTFARMIVSDPKVFMELVRHVGDQDTTGKQGRERQVEVTLDAMWRAMDYLQVGQGRKLVAMAYASLLELVSIRNKWRAWLTFLGKR